MTKTPRPWTPLAVVWLVLAILGLIGTWTFNVLAVIAMRNYIGDWVGSGPAVTSLTTDLLVTAVAASIFMIVEARRLGMRFGWLYVIGAGFTALAFTFPLFLSNRERAIAAQSGAPDASRNSEAPVDR